MGLWRGWGVEHHKGRRTPTGFLGQSSRRVKDRAMRPLRLCLRASLSQRCGRPLGVGSPWRSRWLHPGFYALIQTVVG
jgi:hypothetical protein